MVKLWKLADKQIVRVYDEEYKAEYITVRELRSRLKQEGAKFDDVVLIRTEKLKINVTEILEDSLMPKFEEMDSVDSSWIGEAIDSLTKEDHKAIESILKKAFARTGVNGVPIQVAKVEINS